jgi:perosamine synthetase
MVLDATFKKKKTYQYDTTFSPSSFVEIKKIFSLGQLSVGNYQEKLKNQLKKITSCKYIFLTNSGTTGLHLSLLAVGASKNKDVILPSYLCEEVLNAVKYTQATPKFVDINSTNYSIDLSKTKKSITKKTSAIIVPYQYGDLVDIEILKNSKVPIIEDICHCTGGKISQKYLGSFGSIGITSFNDRKFLDGGYGGAVFTNNAVYAKKIESLLSLSKNKKYRINYNYSIPNLASYVIFEKSKKLNQDIINRRKIADYYLKSFKNTDLKIRYESLKNSFFYRFMIDVPNNKHNFIKKMMSLGIVCGIGVDFPLHKMYGSKENLPNTDLAVKTSIALPIRPNLTNSELRKITTAVKKCINS